VRINQSPKRTQNQSQNRNPSIVSIAGGMCTLPSSASGGSVRRGWLESWPIRKPPYRGVPEPRLVLRGEGMVRTLYPRERREFVPRGEPPHREGGRCVVFGRGEFAGHSFACGQYMYGRNDRSFMSQRSYEPRSPLRGTRSPPRGRVGVPPMRDRMDFANPTFEQMARHWFDSFCTNPNVESFAHSHSLFLFCGWESWRAFG
jgi:hypothetical protein